MKILIKSNESTLNLLGGFDYMSNTTECCIMIMVDQILFLEMSIILRIYRGNVTLVTLIVVASTVRHVSAVVPSRC